MRKLYANASLLFAFFLCCGYLTAQEKPSLKPQDAQKIHARGLIKLDQTQSRSKSGVDIFRDQLQLTQDSGFKLLNIETDKQGEHQRFTQSFKNIPIEFARPVLHYKDGVPVAISGEFYKVQDLNIQASITNNQAFNAALKHVGASEYMWESPGASRELDYKKPTGDLVILPVYSDRGEISTHLAYKFDMFATKPLSRGELYIDAHTGKALFYNAIIKHATAFGHVGAHTREATAKIENIFSKHTATALVTGSAQTRYSGTKNIETSQSNGNYILSDASRKVYTRDALNQAPGGSYPYINNYEQFTDNDNNWTTAEHSVNKDNAALDAHWGAMMTYDYFLNKHNRNSYDGNGAQIRSYVHVDQNYDNAFWNGSVMSYGDGSSNGQEGNGFFDALTSIDVAAHEIGHAVCTYTANLAYQRESGALNEGFSDIWGAAVEHFAKGNGNDFNPTPEIWLIGDEIDRRSGSAALRSMSNPQSLGQPDTYGGNNWINPNCGTPTRSNDYCGVHTNSGVLNFWFYLASVGGSGSNDVGDVYNVAAIGITKSANIAYRAESLYLSANATFANARTATIQAAIDLYGAGGIEEETITNAWYAVNVGEAYSGGGNPGGEDYCSSQGNNVNDEYISKVQLGSINNTSGATGGYTDYTSISTDLAQGESVTITITPTWTGTVYSEGYAVWIDYNQNQSFTDAGELVYSRSATTTTPISGNFTIPASALEGTTRMRVAMKYNGIPSSCETFTYGEVEDYTINITTSSTADTQPPSAPANLSASNVTDTTVDLSWDASSDNIAVTQYNVFMDEILLGTTANTSSTITGLSTGVTYTFVVTAQDAEGNESAASNTITVTTTGGATGGGDTTDTLLASYFENGWDGWQDGGSDCYRYSGARSPEGNYSIRLRDNSGTSSAMTSPALNLASYDAVQLDFSLYAYSMENGEDFWIRYNDGSGWQTVVAYARGTHFNNNTFYTASITLNSVDYNLTNGARIRFQNDASANGDHIYIDEVVVKGIVGNGIVPNSITTSDDEIQGFVESSQGETNFEGDFVIHPNPVNQYASIKVLLDIEDKAVNVDLNVYDLRGSLVLSKKYGERSDELFSEQVDVSSLQSGVYFVEISTDNGVKETAKLIKE